MNEAILSPKSPHWFPLQEHTWLAITGSLACRQVAPPHHSIPRHPVRVVWTHLSTARTRSRPGRADTGRTRAAVKTKELFLGGSPETRFRYRHDLRILRRVCAGDRGDPGTRNCGKDLKVSRPSVTSTADRVGPARTLFFTRIFLNPRPAATRAPSPLLSPVVAPERSTRQHRNATKQQFFEGLLG